MSLTPQIPCGEQAIQGYGLLGKPSGRSHFVGWLHQVPPVSSLGDTPPGQRTKRRDVRAQNHPGQQRIPDSTHVALHRSLPSVARPSLPAKGGLLRFRAHRPSCLSCVARSVPAVDTQRLRRELLGFALSGPTLLPPHLPHSNDPRPLFFSSSGQLIVGMGMSRCDSSALPEISTAAPAGTSGMVGAAASLPAKPRLWKPPNCPKGHTEAWSIDQLPLPGRGRELRRSLADGLQHRQKPDQSSITAQGQAVSRMKLKKNVASRRVTADRRK